MKHLAIIWPNGGTTLSSLILSVEVINLANEYFKTKDKQPVFTISIVGNSNQNNNSGSFIVQPHKTIQEVNHADLIIIPSLGNDIEAALKQNKQLIEWVTNQYKNGAEIAGLCTGTFILAAAGVLKDKQCSTHWNAANIFGSMFPEIDLAIDKIITEAHGVYTTGGALSSMNLVLHIIEKYYDRDTAIYCAKVFEIDPDRNSQSGFIIFSGQKNHEDKEIKKAQLFIEQHVGSKIVIEELSSQFSIERRNFDRRFKKATGNTPVEYMQRVKVEAAKKSFEATRKTINEVMYEVGYSDVKTFRELFKKITGMSPIEYRGKYNKEVTV
jgi:transcriptional regulator GlxA family with amidase domain